MSAPGTLNWWEGGREGGRGGREAGRDGGGIDGGWVGGREGEGGRQAYRQVCTEGYQLGINGRPMLERLTHGPS